MHLSLRLMQPHQKCAQVKGGYREAILKELKDGGTADVCQITQDLD